MRQISFFASVFVCVLHVHDVCAWSGRQQHNQVVSGVDLALAKISANEGHEHDDVYDELSYLQREHVVLDSVSSSHISTDKEISTYTQSLKTLSETFIRMDTLMNAILTPTTMRQQSLLSECLRRTRESRVKIANLDAVLSQLTLIRSTLEQLKQRLDANPSAGAVIGASINIQMTMLAQMMTSATNATQNVPNHNSHDSSDSSLSVSQRRDLLTSQMELLDSFETILNKERQGESSSVAVVQSECVSQNTTLLARLLEGHAKLEAAKSSVGGTIEMFAEAARVDNLKRHETLAQVSEKHNQLREEARNVLELVLESNEAVTLSLCDDNCHGHGTCWTGICRCDSGYSGTTCATSNTVSEI